ncbi:hypothetical protein GCM10022393_15400 [Aquimarina addita]|uniref:Zinc ribbon domain-containing protein n=1 Tax=Aquimarina addita TaxID=870485 RepID=A0ABP7XGZ0_9FLAO
MSDQIYRKCQKCGTMNLNQDYCVQCGAIVNTTLKRKIEREKLIKKKASLQAQNKKNKVSSFIERSQTHPNVIIRYTAKFLYSIWLLVIAIGSLIAFIIGYIAA